MQNVHYIYLNEDQYFPPCFALKHPHSTFFSLLHQSFWEGEKNTFINICFILMRRVSILVQPSEPSVHLSVCLLCSRLDWTGPSWTGGYFPESEHAHWA